MDTFYGLLCSLTVQLFSMWPQKLQEVEVKNIWSFFEHKA